MLTPETIAELEKLLPIAHRIRNCSDEAPTLSGSTDENDRDLAAYAALMALPDLLEAIKGKDTPITSVAAPDLLLLEKLASGEGGTRTGQLIRLGYLKVNVTAAGIAAIRAAKGD